MRSDDPTTAEYTAALASLERALARHPDAELRNHERLRLTPHPHTAAMCRAIEALLAAFSRSKVVVLVEAEVAASGLRSRPEDLVAWIEGAGVLVLEIKSHRAAGIRRFENNVPVVVYAGRETEDVLLIDQPRRFAYELRAQIELEFERAGEPPPALYWAGWLPNVSAGEIAKRGERIDPTKVWLADLTRGHGIPERLAEMHNLTAPSGGAGADRRGLGLFLNVFGCTAGLRATRPARATQPGTLGYTIDRLNNQLKRLTREQEELAFSPQLLRGPKVIRGVAGSGKTIVLANAVANLLLETMRHNCEDMLALAGERRRVRALVLCFNRALAPYLRGLIRQCFEALKPESGWVFPEKEVEVINCHRLFEHLCNAYHVGENRPRYGDGGEMVGEFCRVAIHDVDRYSHVFVDEGQDIEQYWYPFLRGITQEDPELGPSIVVFFDEAQNIYGVRRPGTAGESSWRELLGADVSPRGLRTVMRVGHRNTNEILSFSYNMLLGACAVRDPQMAGFAELNAYAQETIPDDPLLNHPNAGRACVERLGDRRYRINFALRSGPWPELHVIENNGQMARDLARTIARQTAADGEMVDPRDILVMAPRRSSVDAIAAELRRAGLRVHLPLSRDYEQGRLDPRDEPMFQEGAVTVSTIHSAKGHTAAVVHLAAIDRLEADPAVDAQDMDQRARAKCHVAATRATYRLELWGRECAMMREARGVLNFLREAETAARDAEG